MSPSKVNVIMEKPPSLVRCNVTGLFAVLAKSSTSRRQRPFSVLCHFGPEGRLFTLGRLGPATFRPRHMDAPRTFDPAHFRPIKFQTDFRPQSFSPHTLLHPQEVSPSASSNRPFRPFSFGPSTFLHWDISAQVSFSPWTFV